ncbi:MULTISPECIES: NADP-dependent oxidoreductase [unclassified Methylobacterium]|uniref:NADP-dependent oxidoreductase n=1 Tax=unclassified Methylobacterium TaxID=2615210 RepID=UPI00226A1ABF|nr:MULTISPECIES: NADP-dependent oxidoreductase [unclassified Methylobacterium]
METTALTAQRYGQSDVLEFTTFELPSLGSGLARITVRATGVNPVDARRMTGEFRYGTLPLSFGTEFAGTVVALGGDAAGWGIGDEVLGSGGDFTHATVIDVPVANLIRRPPSVPWQIAGSLAGAAQTAMTILKELGPISSLLAHGGAGGVGSILLQLARRRGIAVVATGSEVNQDYLASLGAIPVVYGPGLIERLEMAWPDLFDAAIDMAGTDEATRGSLARVKPDGTVGSVAALQPSSLRIKQIWRRRDPKVVERILAAIVAGDLDWEVSATYPFSDAPNAYDAILGRHVRGKSALVF